MSELPTILVLASGRGERFIASGGAGSKLRALLAGRPVLEHTVAAAAESGLPWHLVDGGHPGMGDSIAAGVQATADSAGWLVLPGDLPLVRPASLRAVAVALEGHGAAVPTYQGRRGHPVGFAAACGPALALLHGAQGAALVLQAQQLVNAVAELPLDDAGIVTDIDTVADLVVAERLLAERARNPLRP
jgi:molybdenum cofactor cytidylyltransferase